MTDKREPQPYGFIKIDDTYLRATRIAYFYKFGDVTYDDSTTNKTYIGFSSGGGVIVNRSLTEVAKILEDVL